jgi:hypothetical protein
MTTTLPPSSAAGPVIRTSFPVGVTKKKEAYLQLWDESDEVLTIHRRDSASGRSPVSLRVILNLFRV